MFFILLSSATLAVESPATEGDETLLLFEWIFTVIFSIEVAIKVLAFGFIGHQHAYLRSTYNVIDFVVVVASILNLAITNVDLGALR